MSKLTIYDISKLSGVSITTVSRVLNGNEHVNPQTRAKIEDVIKKHEYIPQQKARNFSNKKQYAVGLMMDDIRHAYMSELAFAIIEQLQSMDVNAVVCNITNVEKEFADKVDKLLEKHNNGIILMGSVFENELCRLVIERRYTDFPFVAVNANFAMPNVREIMQDHVQGLGDAVHYLYQLGRRRIGWVFYNRSHSDRKKNEGFIRAMEQCGMIPDRTYQVETLSRTAGGLATKEMMVRYPDLDAIVYSSDILAVGGVHVLNDMGINIPGHIAVIGFNNSSCAIDCYPQLTSIDNRIADSGTIAARMMVDILNKQEVENKMLKCGLVIRKSTE